MPEFPPQIIVLLGAAALAVLLGVVMAATNFCTLGAVSDWVTTGDRRRFRAWLLAMAMAIAGATLLQLFGSFDPVATRIPYAAPVFAWPRYLLGGLMFGTGMALCSGCPSRQLVRAGMGSGKALLTLACIALAAALMTRTAFYEYTFQRWMQPLFIDLGRFGLPDQRLPTIILGPIGVDGRIANGLCGLAAATLLAGYALRSGTLRLRRGLRLGAILIGVVITLGWLLTSSALGRRWIEDAEFMLEIPPGVGVQSFTFVGPLADTLSWFHHPGDIHRFTFGMAGVAGMLLGAYGYALKVRRWRWEWFRSAGDLLRQVCGAALLGIGGVLALGCSIGQGITGVSTLALGSAATVVAILVGCALTIKTEYYLLVYAERGNLFVALIAAAVDLRLLPKRCRRLDRVA